MATAAPVPGAAAGSPPGPATGSTIVIGNVGDYSGPVGSVLKNGVTMSQVVARFINDHGGLNGHPVKIVSADAGGDPARALSIVRDMVENQGAVAFMANLLALSGRGPREYLEQKQIPVIGGDVTQRVWNESPMYFAQGTSFPTVSLGAVKSAVTAGKKKIAVIYCVEAEPCKIWNDAATSKGASLGAQIVYSAQITLAQPDFTAECLQAQRNGAEAVMAGMESASLIRLARSCAQQGFRPQWITASFATSAAKDPNLDGLLAPVQTFPVEIDDLPGAQAYRAAVQRYAPNLDHSPTTSAVWTSGALLREAAKQLPAKPTSADLLQGLWQIKNNTLGGLAPPLTFVERQPAPEIKCFFVIRNVKGKFTAPNGSKQDCI